MNLKDRLNAPSKKNINVELKDDSEISDIFLNNKFADEIISEYIVSGRNFIVTGTIDCDKSIVAVYINKFAERNTKINFCGVGVKGIVSMFENVISGAGYNISYVDIKSYDDVCKNIILLMSVNLPNIKENKINEILKEINPLIIHADKDDDGLFYIKNIGELENDGDNLIIKNIYPSQAEEKDLLPDNIVQDNETAEDVQTVDEIVSEDKPIVIEKRKVNKYKLLKEKVHRKHSQL